MKALVIIILSYLLVKEISETAKCISMIYSMDDDEALEMSARGRTPQEVAKAKAMFCFVKSFPCIGLVIVFLWATMQ
jgi:hypothetical protein